MHIILIRKII